MEQIKMYFEGKPQVFRVTYRCAAYIFCECESNPVARGFFTNEYVEKNQVK